MTIKDKLFRLLEILDDIKENISSNQYKEIIENLQIMFKLDEKKNKIEEKNYDGYLSGVYYGNQNRNEIHEIFRNRNESNYLILRNYQLNAIRNRNYIHEIFENRMFDIELRRTMGLN